MKRGRTKDTGTSEVDFNEMTCLTSTRIAEQARAGWLARVKWVVVEGESAKVMEQAQRCRDRRKQKYGRNDATDESRQLKALLFSIGAFGDNLKSPTLSRQSVSAIDHPARLGSQIWNPIHALT